MALELRDTFGIDEAERRGLQDSIRSLGMLGDVISWGLARKPVASIADVIVQDEYSHDVVVELGTGRWLSFEWT